MDHYQLYCHAGPAYESARGERPVLSNNVWHDHRWPRLDVGRACELYPGYIRQLHDVYGVATLPVARNDAGPVLLSAYLKGPPAPTVLERLSRYEILVAAAVFAISACAGPDQANRILDTLRSRIAVEQAKGIVMGRCRTDSASAAMILEQVSTRSRTDLSVLAAELAICVQQQPDDLAPSARPQSWAGLVADDLWRALCQHHGCGDVAPELWGDDHELVGALQRIRGSKNEKSSVDCAGRRSRSHREGDPRRPT